MVLLLLLQVYADALLVFNNARTYNKLPTEDVHYMANRVQVGGVRGLQAYAPRPWACSLPLSAGM